MIKKNFTFILGRSVVLFSVVGMRKQTKYGKTNNSEKF